MNTDKDILRSDSDKWCLWMFIIAIISFLTNSLGRFSFGLLGENMTLNMRKILYQTLLKKNIGWFDLRENSTGVLTSVLASDA